MKNETTKRPARSWEAAGAICCFSGGIGAALLGTVLTVTAWLMSPEPHPWLHGLGTVLLIATIPLLIFCGYCLDWAERKLNQSSTQQSRKGGQESLLS